jgi:hypothetical protein
MKFVAATLSLAATASAFAPSANNARSATHLQETKADLQGMAKKLNPVLGYFDPLSLSDATFWGTSNEATIGFLRESEIKHGRIAMFAFVGYIVHANGIHFPFPMKMDGTPFPSGNNPPELWDAIPDSAKWQIFLFIGALEYWNEVANKHYMAGGKPGDFPDFEGPMPFNYYDPFGLNKGMSEEKKASRLIAEVNNGRLAQLGILGFLSEQTTPGSVPLLSGIVQPYSGEPMAPFSHSIFPSL